MTGVLVTAGSGSVDQRRWRLSPGDELAFGSGAELVMPDEQLPGVVGRIRATESRWCVRNDTDNTPVIAESRPGPDFLTIAGGVAVLVPFASARVLVFANAGIFGFSVQATTCLAPRVRHGGPRLAPLLSEDAKYFRVLVALCEPALRYGSALTVPTSAEIAGRLRRLPSYRSITTTAVDFHLNYLCTQKLRPHVEAYSSIVGAPVPTIARNRRAALVELSLRFNLVSSHHLRLLDLSRRPGQSGRG